MSKFVFLSVKEALEYYNLLDSKICLLKDTDEENPKFSLTFYFDNINEFCYEKFFQDESLIPIQLSLIFK
jgi:hypothetical protein